MRHELTELASYVALASIVALVKFVIGVIQSW